MIRLLVRRYVTNEQRILERKRGVTEDDCNEIKQDISALRFELIELMNKRTNSHQALNGCSNCLQNDFCFDPIYCNCNKPFNSKKCSDDADETSTSYHYQGLSKSNLPLSGSYGNLNQGLSNQVSSTGKRDRQKERRLMKGFDFNCLYLDSNTSLDKDCALLMQNMSSSNQNLLLNNLQSINGSKGKPQNRNRFMRLARGIASKRTRGSTNTNNFLSNLNSSLMSNNRTDSLTSNNKWKQLIEATRNKAIKPIFSRSSESVNSDVNLQNLKLNKKEISNYQLDANVKRSLFARKITSLLKDDHFSLDAGQDACNLKEMSSSLSKTLSSNSDEFI